MVRRASPGPGWRSLSCVTDLPRDLDVSGERAAAGAIEEKKTSGPGESACAGGRIDASLGATHKRRKVKKINGSGLQLTLVSCDGQVGRV